MSGSYFLTIKSLHVIFVVAWFAGLFYVPRLFIYQTEARRLSAEEGRPVINHLKVMARRLWNIITWPAAVLAVGFGVWMLVMNPAYLYLPWMQVKLIIVGILIAYHLALQYIYNKLQRNIYPFSEMGLRFFNEVPTLILFAIIFTVIFKTTRSWFYGVAGIVALGILLSLGILLYRKIRAKAKD